MTYTLIKHDTDDYRMHDSSGAVVQTWDSKPDAGQIYESLDLLPQGFIYRRKDDIDDLSFNL